jgi:hypothetical protein
MNDGTIEAITSCAIPGFTALRAWIGATDEPRTEALMAESLYAQPVIAWRHVVERDAYGVVGEEFRYVEPVMPDLDDWGEVADALDALEFPDGRVRIPGEEEFPDRAAFIRYAFRRWSERRVADSKETEK